jgi:hypothetical protein
MNKHTYKYRYSGARQLRCTTSHLFSTIQNISLFKQLFNITETIIEQAIE